MEHRSRGSIHFDDERNRFTEHRVLVWIEAVGVAVGAARIALCLDLLEQILSQRRLALRGPELSQLGDLRLIDVGALDPLKLR